MTDDDLTALLAAWERGDAEAGERLLPLVYGELKKVARGYLRRERPEHTLNATALVHEAYLRLVDQRRAGWESRGHFLAIAAQAMRRILVDHARRRRAGKRGEGNEPLPLEAGVALAELPDVDLLALHEALGRLGEASPRQERVVELRFFGGLSIEETAAHLGVSPATVKLDWTHARAWLYRELERGRP